MNNRAGIFINQPNGYRSFKPEKLPPNPPVDYLQMISLLSEADRKLGRLDGITQILPNPELFVAMYVQKEAVLSSQIEGTQASLSDVLENNENLSSFLLLFLFLIQLLKCLVKEILFWKNNVRHYLLIWAFSLVNFLNSLGGVQTTKKKNINKRVFRSR